MGLYYRELLLCKDVMVNTEASTKESKSLKDVVIISAHSCVIVLKGFYKKKRDISHVNLFLFDR